MLDAGVKRAQLSPHSGGASELNSVHGDVPLLAALVVAMVSVIFARYWCTASEIRMQQEQGRNKKLKDMAAALEVATRTIYDLRQQVHLVYSESTREVQLLYALAPDNSFHATSPPRFGTSRSYHPHHCHSFPTTDNSVDSVVISVIRKYCVLSKLPAIYHHTLAAKQHTASLQTCGQSPRVK